MVTTGVWTWPLVSLTVNVRVTMSPVYARVDVALFEAMVAVGMVGAVRSKVTFEPLVTAVLCAAALPALSLTLMVNGTTPSVSPASMVRVAVKLG